MANPIANELDLNNLEDDDFVDTGKGVKEETEKEAKEVTTPEPEKAKEDENKSEEAKKEEESAKEEEKDPDIDALIASLEKELENTNKRYEASSNEGKRLYQENQELQEKLNKWDEVQPVLDVLAKNPELREIAKQMISGTYTGQLPEETLDLDEAVRNPESASAKVLKSLVQAEAAKLVNAQNAKTSVSSDKTARENALNIEIEEVSKERNLSEAEVNDVINFARNKKNVSFRDMVDLYNLEKGNGKAPQTDMLKLLDQIKQLNKTSKMEKNIKGSETVEKTPDQKVRDLIRGAGGNDLNDLIPT